MLRIRLPLGSTLIVPARANYFIEIGITAT